MYSSPTQLVTLIYIKKILARGEKRWEVLDGGKTIVQNEIEEHNPFILSSITWFNKCTSLLYTKERLCFFFVHVERKENSEIFLQWMFSLKNPRPAKENRNEEQRERGSWCRNLFSRMLDVEREMQWGMGYRSWF